MITDHQQLTSSLKDLLADFHAHFEAGKLSAVRLDALELDVTEELVQQHYGALFGHNQLLLGSV